MWNLRLEVCSKRAQSASIPAVKVESHNRKNVVAAVTGIDAAVLRRSRRVKDYSVAQRMSWAAFREAERPEDEAYSLLGLFDVSMPLLYGEERKAFLRLQETIIAKSDVHQANDLTLR